MSSVTLPNADVLGPLVVRSDVSILCHNILLFSPLHFSFLSFTIFISSAHSVREFLSGFDLQIGEVILPLCCFSSGGILLAGVAGTPLFSVSATVMEKVFESSAHPMFYQSLYC